MAAHDSRYAAAQSLWRRPAGELPAAPGKNTLERKVTAIVKTPMTPLDFMRRARRLYGEREAVVDEGLRLSYSAFFERCDKWSAVLQRYGIGKGDRVAYLAPNTHALLEGFYAVPQIGAILVPINYRLTADDFAYIINHSGARIVCAHADQLDALESIRTKLPAVERFIALEGAKAGWLDYEAELARGAAGALRRPAISKTT